MFTTLMNLIIAKFDGSFKLQSQTKTSYVNTPISRKIHTRVKIYNKDSEFLRSIHRFRYMHGILVEVAS